MTAMGMILKALSGLGDGLAFALALTCLAAALGAHGGRFSGRLDLLTHFAPFWLVGAALALAYGLTLATPSVRLLIAALGGLGAVAAAALMIPELIRPMAPKAPADAPHQGKIIQFNSWRRNSDVERTADWLVAQNPDVIAIEEIAPPLRAAILRRRRYSVAHGIGQVTILSRSDPLPAPFSLGPNWGQLPGISRARLPAPDGAAFDIVAIHYLWPTERFQTVQRRAMADIVDRYDPKRLIVVGDLNLTPWSFALRRQDAQFGLERRTRALFTWPVRPFARGRLTAPVPFLPIDQVYAGSDWRTVSIERGPRLGSDHLPIVVTLALKD
jgi:endonuclease/exonuclease/phosphatase (EEP) superfamily protein YafD